MLKQILISTVFILTLLSCKDSTNTRRISPPNESYLPAGSIIEKRLGGGWLIFSLNNNKYLYRLDLSGNATTEVLAPYHD